jgi:uncharacterized protein with PIN domain
MNPAFIADAHLGKLARVLRLLGFDVLYNNAVADTGLLAAALEQNRILLSRNRSCARNTAVRSLIICSEDPNEQVQQVVQDLHLKNAFRPFTRCLVCNEMLAAVSKESILPRLEQNTSRYYNEFWQCAGCKRIYWEGAHYLRMLALVQKVVPPFIS